MAYNTKTNKWTYVASMNDIRRLASSTVFRGKVVVTGGWVKRHFSFCTIKSVEAYCFYENKWTKLPDMLKARSGHGSVSLGNKMFVISRNLSNSCEMFYSISNKFTLLKTKPYVNNIDCYLLKTFCNLCWF